MIDNFYIIYYIYRKKELVLERRKRAINNITQRYHNRCANRIIRILRIYTNKKKEERLKAEAIKSKAMKRSANLIEFEKQKKETENEQAKGLSIIAF